MGRPETTRSFARIARVSRELRGSRFAARVTGLGGASVVSQCFGAVALFLMTRALSPSQVGQYQLFLATSALVASVSLLSYHSVLPHLEEAGYRTLTKALLVWNVFVGLVTASVLLLLRVPLPMAIGAQVLAAGFTSIAEMSNIRAQKTSRIAFARLALSISNLAWVALSCFAFRVPSLERLVYGQVALALVTGVVYAALTLRGALGGRLHWRELRPIIVLKRNCAFYYAPSELLGSMTFNLPTILIERYFGLALAGQFGVVLRFCGAPVTILSNTIGQIYHGSLARAVRERAPGAHRNFLRLRRALIGVGASSGLGVFLFVPLAVTLLLGPTWNDAANIARALSPMYGTMIAVGPLVASFQVFEAQRAMLLLQIGAATISAVSFVLAGTIGHFWVGVGLYSLFVSIRYLVVLVSISKMSRQRLLAFEST
ncbi:O-antigen flippase Wzx [Labilithrix luteola]|uniref:O-antigen flippase Wzx n=1 Tax=Labilithrix luteola TaxID=1391654 RepID=A0A0K1PZ41_9BACT|nr:hypothetical protein [Labilithrix luteola]AKU98795.1 O-antigen flippase Wzx [Labilithrix luteola]